MNLDLKRPLLFFDIESTGLDIATDCIAELCFLKVFPNGKTQERIWRFRPWDYPKDNLSGEGRQHKMDPSASKVNGITDDDLKGEKPFICYISEIADWLEGCDLGGYNSERYDLPLLASELERAREYCKMRIGGENVPESKKESARKALEAISRIDLQGSTMVDVQKIVYKAMPRTLKSAYALFHEGRDFEDAHSAAADTRATYELLLKMAEIFNVPGEHSINHVIKVEADDLLGLDAEALAEYPLRKRDPVSGELVLDKEEFYDIAGKLIRKSDGKIYINFGKYRGKTIEELYRLDTGKGFLKWVLDKDFTQDTKDKLSALYAECEKKSLDALKDKFKS